MGPSGARAGSRSRGASSASSTGGSARDSSIPDQSPIRLQTLAKQVNVATWTLTHEPTSRRSNQKRRRCFYSLPSIKNLFGLERAEPLASVRREMGVSDDGHSSLAPQHPAHQLFSTQLAPLKSLDHRSHRGHASTSSFSEFQSGLSHSSSSSSLGPNPHSTRLQYLWILW